MVDPTLVLAVLVGNGIIWLIVGILIGIGYESRRIQRGGEQRR